MNINSVLEHFRAVWGFDLDDDLIPSFQKALDSGMMEKDMLAAVDLAAGCPDTVDAGEATLDALREMYRISCRPHGIPIYGGVCK